MKDEFKRKELLESVIGEADSLAFALSRVGRQQLLDGETKSYEELKALKSTVKSIAEQLRQVAAMC